MTAFITFSLIGELLSQIEKVRNVQMLVLRQRPGSCPKYFTERFHDMKIRSIFVCWVTKRSANLST